MLAHMQISSGSQGSGYQMSDMQLSNRGQIPADLDT